MTHRASLSTCAVLAAAGLALAGQPQPLSGLKTGERPMPYAFVVATGPQRGQTFCYICDTADKPAVIVFARALSEPLGKLAAKLDQAVADAAVPELRSWLTLLTAGNQPGAEKRLVDWGRTHALRQMPLGVFEDEVGPPAYQLNQQAEVTVILFVQQKVAANYTFKAGELTDERIDDVVKELAKLKSGS